MVVGEQPNELMSKYDSNLVVDKYIRYRYLDADKMKKNAIKVFSEILNEPKRFNLSDYHIDALRERIKVLHSMSTFEYYSNITSGLFIDNNGDAWSTENKNGKWSEYNNGGSFSIPLVLKDGSETYSSFAENIDWNKMHMQDTALYDLTWDLVHGNKKPSNAEEDKICNNMKMNSNYFARFKDKNEYIMHSCAYWNYAYLDKNGWKDIDDEKNDISWISTFYDKFCKPLKPKDLVTIFECIIDNNN